MVEPRTRVTKVHDQKHLGSIKGNAERGDSAKEIVGRFAFLSDRSALTVAERSAVTLRIASTVPIFAKDRLKIAPK
jgi:hypothetical protein